jgi:nucleoside-diphosphate-sugar epimerase
MNLLVYGSKGWIGKQFISYLNNNHKDINICLGESRMDNLEDLRIEIENFKPTNIISFIGRTHGKIGDVDFTTIDYLEQEGKLVENIRDNLFSPISLGLLCIEKNIHYAYLGTGCIFNYDSTHPYGKEINGFTEESNPNFFGSSYSVVKGFTDRLMHQLEANCLNMRIRMPINSENCPRNFITKITNYEKICSIPNSMTVLPDFFPVMFDLLQNRKIGTINLTNPGLVSHNEILEMYKEIVDPTFTYKNFSIEEQDKILASKRSNNYLDTSKIELLYPEVPNIKVSIRKILEKYK